MNYNFLKVLGVIAFLTSLPYLQKDSNLPESVYMNISFSVLQPQGEFANNVTNKHLSLMTMIKKQLLPQVKIATLKSITAQTSTYD